MQSFHREQKAVTLIELMIVIAIIGVVFTAIYNTHLTGWRVWNFSQDRVKLQQTARLLMMRISRDARSARKLKIEPDGYMVTLYYGQGDDLEEIRYEIDKDNKKLRRSEKEKGNSNFGEPELFATGIIDIEAYQEEPFKKDGGIFEVIFNLKTGNQGDSFETKIYLRNYKGGG
ncbi:PilW family protein [Natroniella sp. ANB-PHB2]|uniref:PilW family protein n=1 Tax=Natroniella sp. ANB-PHB2 TaxID=3384444 RepID=UPI0038D38D4F